MKNMTFGEVENNHLLKNNGKLKIMVHIEKSGFDHAFLQSYFSSPYRIRDSEIISGFLRGVCVCV